MVRCEVRGHQDGSDGAIPIVDGRTVVVAYVQSYMSAFIVNVSSLGSRHA